MERPSSSASLSSPASSSTLSLPELESVNLPQSPITLRNGRRGDLQNHSYSGTARQGPVRYISPASLTLSRIMEQDRMNAKNNNAVKVPDIIAPGPVAAAKSKPRLCLMGQRRYAMISLCWTLDPI